ncbi:MCE family protein [Mycobacterium sp. CBMA293]|uniref:MlaD family protein n=1 Tax=unclassified Mycolicibacterium TaxID=2636767 RepID=UPI0012DD0EA1|nr:MULTISPECIES: MCE family protein [unclassified Mycolicibacterium]MUL47421.1 MCE family protein [Mycolicibacterium sp. CBMA 360]MUL59406.1 MCE family protein [Mycolicibacterium sp. CBMA 335]MUL71131.1 MCE family protein [Mycolicibacterium sp. CBMA 311]MUL94774.1 MCE family protein [Mycolicibacterium sp. CBMA 230]MUM03615.1 mammalian cell entry protein [Mycolicibacterium sp. CBMA 213]
MPNSFDTDPRGSTDKKLTIVGLCFAMIAALAAALMVAKSQGLLDNLVRVDIKLMNIGDGLPTRSDVKFRGVLVGTVSGVVPSEQGQPNVVHANLEPRYAARIPNTVTARVVPSNLFAVSAVQLVDNGPGPGFLQTDAVITEDQTLPTVLFQNVLAKLRQLLAAVGHTPDQDSVGILAALAQATHGRGAALTNGGRDLNAVLTQLNSVVSPDDSGPTTLSALQQAADSLQVTSPDLFDALDHSIQPMHTIAEKRTQLTDFLTGGLRTTTTLGDAFDHQSDRMIAVSTQLSPVLGVLADHADQFHGVSTRLQTLAGKFNNDSWNPDTKMLTIKAVVGFAPSRTYVRTDCPHYGALQGPSCLTAPEIPTAPDLRPGLASMGVSLPPGVTENRPNFAPPRDSTRGAPDPDPALGPPPPGPPLPAEAPGPAAPDASPPITFGGNVGPVGSHQEKDQLSAIVGGPATTATQLLLGPVTRGTTVSITPASDNDHPGGGS